MPDYSPEQLWPIYEKLPEDLKEAIFSEKTADNIHDICTRNGIGDERISQIAKYVGYVLLGVLIPEKLPEVLEKEVKLKKEVAKKVFQEINRFIFFPLKESLAFLYQAEVPRPTVPKIRISEIAPSDETIPPEEEPKRDTYREPIE